MFRYNRNSKDILFLGIVIGKNMVKDNLVGCIRDWFLVYGGIKIRIRYKLFRLNGYVVGICYGGCRLVFIVF